MLDIKNFSYRYPSRDQFTLHDINLTLGEGKMLLLAGRSGCGKSTLIKAISCQLGSDGLGELQGDIYLEGQQITYWSPEQIGQMVGTVYQSPDDQLFAMTVADEVGFALENQGLDPDYIHVQVTETLRLVGLAGFEETSIHKLSGGQRQRLALASILITKPQLLILDEPVSQMNPQGVQDFMQLLVRLNQDEHIAVLVIELRVNELYKYFDRLAVMQDGRILFDGPMEEAWAFLTNHQDVGVREPQQVKLCRALHLPVLTTNNTKVVEMLQENHLLSKASQDPASNIMEQDHRLLQDIVSIEDVSFTYPTNKQPTLKHLNFALEAGQITALMGFNGAGKSTLLNLLGGLTQTKEGRITLDQLPIQQVLGQIGYLRQEPDLMLLADTVREELSWKNKAMTSADVDVMLHKLHLEEYAEDFPLALSKGQRLRVVLGAMLAKKPRLLLLDEPTTGQDEQSLSEIKKLLQDFKAEGGSVFICTHDVELAAEVADRAIVLRQGEVLVDDAATTVLSNVALLEEGGLTPSPLLDITQRLHLPACVTVKEVLANVE